MIKKIKIRDGETRTATSTFTQLLNSSETECFFDILVAENVHRELVAIGTVWYAVCLARHACKTAGKRGQFQVCPCAEQGYKDTKIQR